MQLHGGGLSVSLNRVRSFAAPIGELRDAHSARGSARPHPLLRFKCKRCNNLSEAQARQMCRGLARRACWPTRRRGGTASGRDALGAATGLPPLSP